MKSNARTAIVVAIMAMASVWLSILVPVTVATKADLEAVELGWPLPYIIQNQSRLDPAFPFETRFRSMLEYPTDVLL